MRQSAPWYTDHSKVVAVHDFQSTQQRRSGFLLELGVDGAAEEFRDMATLLAVGCDHRPDAFTPTLSTFTSYCQMLWMRYSASASQNYFDFSSTQPPKPDSATGGPAAWNGLRPGSAVDLASVVCLPPSIHSFQSDGSIISSLPSLNRYGSLDSHCSSAAQVRKNGGAHATQT